MKRVLERLLPGLRSSFYATTSAATQLYNCIAWSVDDNRRWWWPDNKNYWPPGLPCEESVGAFEALYASLGYTLTLDDTLEPNVEKVALFAKDTLPKHAARQLGSGMWTSKLGGFVDIVHELRALEGREYGRVAVVFQRPTKGP